MNIITRKYLQGLEWRLFGSDDIWAFAGVESPVPLIATDEERNYIVVLDGSFVDIYDDNMELVEQCFDISGLEYEW